MKKSRPRKPETVEQYLAAVPEPARTTLNKIRATICSAVPKETAEVISYGIPGFRYRRMLMWYAAFADHCSLFPTASVIAELKDDLKKYRVSKGTIQFPVDKPLPAALSKRWSKCVSVCSSTNSRSIFGFAQNDCNAIEFPPVFSATTFALEAT